MHYVGHLGAMSTLETNFANLYGIENLVQQSMFIGREIKTLKHSRLFVILRQANRTGLQKISKVRVVIRLESIATLGLPAFHRA